MVVSNNVDVGTIEYDANAPIGSKETVVVPLRLTIGFVGTSDPNFCNIPFNLNDGYEVQVNVSIDGFEQDGGTFCIPAGQNRYQYKTFSVRYPGDAGNHTLTVKVYLPGTGVTVSEQTFQITTTEDPTNGNGEIDGVCTLPILGPLYCGLFGDGDLGKQLTQLEIVIALVALAIIVDSVTDVFN